MITKKSIVITWVAWVLISGYYLSEENFGISISIGALVLMFLYRIVNRETQPILNKIPDSKKDNDEEDIDFSKLPGYVPPEQRRPIPRGDRPRNPKNL